MGKVPIAVHGATGTIGRRVTVALSNQPDMEPAVVAVRAPSMKARALAELGYPLYVSGEDAEKNLPKFEAEGIPVQGLFKDAIRSGKAVLVVEATPEGAGKRMDAFYESVGVRVLYEGGEDADVAEMSFLSNTNYDKVRAAMPRTLRSVSCNTTGLGRSVPPLAQKFGPISGRATLVRRIADPGEIKKVAPNSLTPGKEMPSHHAPDLQTVADGLENFMTTAVIAPTTLMHLHVNEVTLTQPTTLEEILALWASNPRIAFFPSSEAEGTAQIMEIAKAHGRPDLLELAIWKDLVHFENGTLWWYQAVHQESIVVPENIDAIRAQLGLASNAGMSTSITNQSLGIPLFKAARREVPPAPTD